MKRHEYPFAIVLLFLCGLASTSAQHEYDWDKVDEKGLNERQPPDKVMDSLGVKPGMIVGEVGAGGGRYAVKMAERVGPTGKVFANDIAPSAIDYLVKRCDRDDIGNIEVILGTETDPRFPPGQLDLVYLTFTYRHLSKPLEVLENIRPALKANGLLAIIESKPSGDRSEEKAMLSNAEKAGYTLVRIETFLDLDDIWIFRPQES